MSTPVGIPPQTPSRSFRRENLRKSSCVCPDWSEEWPIEWVVCYAGDAGPNPHGAPPLITPITNGLGAGLSFEQALCHGLLELLQRDGNSVRFRALARGAAIELSSVRDVEARAILYQML